LVTLASFGVYIWINPDDVLTADRIFACLTLFNILRIPLTHFPEGALETIKLFVALRRISEVTKELFVIAHKHFSQFMHAEEVKDAVADTMLCEKNAVEITNGTFSWGKQEEESSGFSLRNINLSIPKSSLVAVVGSVGCGKSSLISAILGELECTSGQVKREGQVAYVPQQPWIQNMVKNMLARPEFIFF